MTALILVAAMAVFAVLMVAVAITVAAERIRTMDLARVEAHRRRPARLVCDLEECDEPSAVEFDCGLDGNMFICRLHAGRVSQWAPVVGIREGLL